MTHDELLERLDELKYDVGDSGMNEEYKAIYALRAVVELHKPVAFGNAYWCANDCHAETKLTRKQRAKGMTKWLAPVRYPCPTIQAIEKELK